MDKGAWWAASPWGCKELNMTERPSTALAFSGLPGGSDSKESTCNAGDLDSILGLERFLEKERALTPVFLPGKFHGQTSMVGVHGVTKSWTQLSD